MTSSRENPVLPLGDSALQSKHSAHARIPLPDLLAGQGYHIRVRSHHQYH